ncbi:MAG TPA: ubiquinol-cytochrome c reductase iron-sulfur subunit [Ignavibacteria bacterium]|nr:ubiquinol-cytochrome c reductase iron-sulfur subunit [Ignavibacteria bacterium]HMQ97401.1 ubiquinol-cytochrome c reductase iron-sulfur subunit [Ignavibacteria bacterium]
MAGKLSRRDFIKRSAVGVIASGAMLSTINIEALTRSAVAAKAVFRKSGDDVVVKLSENAALTKAGGSVKINDELMLIRSSETSFLAVRTICTHKGCDVELEGDKFVCPCHGSEYTMDGKVTQGPAKTNLKTFETIFDSDKGTVTIKTGENVKEQ